MNKAMKWMTGILAAAVLVKGFTIRDWSRETRLLWQIVEAGAESGCRVMLTVRYPTAGRTGGSGAAGVAALRAEAEEADPAYRIYQEYRYAYDTYGYLFLADEASGAGAEAESPDSQQEAGAGEEPETAGASALAGPVYAVEQLRDYDFLMKHFYGVHSSTTAGRDVMNADTFLNKDLRLEKDSSVPQILIYHTHTQETYADYGPGNEDATVIGIGNYLTTLLQEKGWNVLHDTSGYDIREGKLDRNRAYTYALEGINGILQQNPSIQVVLDLHRDGVQPGVHLVSEVNGKPTASIMFFQGMSRTPEGAIEYLPNPYLEDNLAFSFQMQLDAAKRYPGLTRKIYLKGLRYNLHVRPRSALIEVGAQTNSYAEARNAMEPLAELLDRVLQGN